MDRQADGGMAGRWKDRQTGGKLLKSRCLFCQNPVISEFGLCKKDFTLCREAGEERCECDYTFNEHSSKAKKARDDSLQSKWSHKDHSVQEKTDAFGEIEFVNQGGNVGKVCTRLSVLLGRIV